MLDISVNRFDETWTFAAHFLILILSISRVHQGPSEFGVMIPSSQRLKPKHYYTHQKQSFFKKLWLIRSTLAMILTPIILLPIIFVFPQSQSEARCAYCVILMATYWVMESIPLAVTALLPMLLFPVLGLMKSDEVAQMYLPDTSFLFIGGLMIAVAVQKSKLHNRVALLVLSSVPPQPHWITLGFMAITASLSMWISNTATAALMVPIANSVIMEFIRNNRKAEIQALTNEAVIEERHNENSDGRRKSIASNFSLRDPTEIFSAGEFKLAKGLLMGIALSANLGGMGTVIGNASNLVLMGQIREMFPRANTGINFISWMVFAVPLVIICTVSAWLTLVLLYLRKAPKGGVLIRAKMIEKYNELPPLTFAEGAVSCCFLGLLLLWVTRDLQFVRGFGSLFKKGYVTDATSAILITVLLFALPEKRPDFSQIGQNRPDAKASPSLLDWKTVQAKFPWSVVLLLGGGFAMAAGVQESNLNQKIGDILENLQIFPKNVIMMVCILIAVFTTNLCSNTVTASIFIPIFGGLAKTLEIHPMYLMIPVTIASSLGFTLPVATPPNAIVFATGLLKAQDMIITGTIVTMECCIFVIIAMMSWGSYLFSLHEFPEWAYTPTELILHNHTLIDLLINATNI